MVKSLPSDLDDPGDFEIFDEEAMLARVARMSRQTHTPLRNTRSASKRNVERR